MKIKSSKDFKNLINKMKQADQSRLKYIWFYYDEELNLLTHMTTLGLSKLSLIISEHEALDQEFDKVDVVSSLIDTLYTLNYVNNQEGGSMILNYYISSFIEKLQFHYEA